MKKMMSLLLSLVLLSVFSFGCAHTTCKEYAERAEAAAKKAEAAAEKSKKAMELHQKK